MCSCEACDTPMMRVDLTLKGRATNRLTNLLSSLRRPVNVSKVKTPSPESAENQSKPYKETKMVHIVHRIDVSRVKL